MVKHLMHYLARTSDFGIVLNLQNNTLFIMPTDVNYANVQRNLFSTTNYLVMISGRPVVWYNKKQRLHTMSAAETEYITAKKSLKEGIWVIQLLEILNKIVKRKIDLPLTMKIDLSACIKMIE